MEDSGKGKAGSNAVTTYSDTKRNIPRGLSVHARVRILVVIRHYFSL
jgi:hypothetical protein